MTARKIVIKKKSAAARNNNRSAAKKTKTRTSARTKAPAAQKAPARSVTAKRMPARSVTAKKVPARSVAAKKVFSVKQGGSTAVSKNLSPAPRPSMSPADAKKFEEILLGERRRLMREMGHLENNVLNRSMRESSGEMSGYSFHMADIGTDSMEREKAFLFASAEGRALIDVNDALRRLYNGQYGNCEVCNKPVGKGRLEVVPHARLCVSCKEDEERNQMGSAR